MWKIIIISLLIILIGSFTTFYLISNKKIQQETPKKILSPFVNLVDAQKSANINKGDGEVKNNPMGEPISLLLLGIDRRSKEEYGFRTDVMIDLIINPLTNQVVMISVPRDLWYQGERINALFIQGGWEEMQNAFYLFTGYKPQRYILTDFKDFSWIVDAMGGVNVDVDTSFTDSQYPVDETLGYQTIFFDQGEEKLTGERALIYARSRKGDNGEGSDWMRMKRQHKILKGMLNAIIQPGSLFNPMVVENAFKTVTTGKMDTNLNLTDAKYLWDFYKDKDEYNITSLYLDTDYLYNPPMEDYGGAWVLISRVENFDDFKTKISNILNGADPITSQNGNSTNL